MDDVQKKRCRAIIHGASAAAAAVGAGFAALPVPDACVLVPLQTAMVVSLGKVFDRSITEASAKALVGSSLAKEVGQAGARFFVGKVPVVGQAANAVIAAGLTETLGWVAAREFDKGQI
jgi:Uncharacterized protein/domain associated with GTPases